MIFSVRYTPEAVRDLDSVWDGVVEASKSYIVCRTTILRCFELSCLREII